LNPNDPFPNPINGVTYTVSALRDKILWEPWGVLIVNIILAVVMTGLAVCGKRAPLAAALIAAATYIVVIVTNAACGRGWSAGAREQELIDRRAGATGRPTLDFGYR
jgi:MFS superfamily sulfate permease-like transporter